jgi:septum formation protein
MKIILGSNSPRRKELLEDMGYSFQTRTIDTDESYSDSTKPIDVAKTIALKKSEALLGSLSNEELLICADTVVIVNDEVLGKPKNKLEAIQMLKNLSGKTHLVITAVTFSTKKETRVDQSITEVTFKKLNEDEINFYIETYKPFDKAGAYGIQEWIGYIGVTNIKGSYFNVVGLPTHLVDKNIKDILKIK